MHQNDSIPIDPAPSVPAVLAIDAELVDRVRRAGAGSPEYRYLQQALEDVAIGTLTNLEKRRKLHHTVAKKGCRLWRPIPPSYPFNFRAIVYIAVRTTSPRFMKKQVLEDGWKQGQASLKTYFVSATLYSFAQEYNRFCREEELGKEEECFDVLPMNLQDDSRQLSARIAQDPEATVIARDLIGRSLPAGTDPLLKWMLVRTAQQYTQPEIADELGISAEAVSSAIRRLRRRLTTGQEGSNDGRSISLGRQPRKHHEQPSAKPA